MGQRAMSTVPWVDLRAHSGAFGTFTVANDTRYTRAKLFSEVGRQTGMFVRFSVVTGERGAADADRDIRGFATTFYTEESNWGLRGGVA